MAIPHYAACPIHPPTIYLLDHDSVIDPAMDQATPHQPAPEFYNSVYILIRSRNGFALSSLPSTTNQLCLR